MLLGTMLSPRRVQALFLSVTLLFAAAVGWLGWRLLEQDRALARQRRMEQLDAAAERAAGALFRRLAEFEEMAGGGALAAGVVRIRRVDGRPEVTPENGLLYWPVTLEGKSVEGSVFAASEEREFRRNDPAGAAELLRGLAGAGDPAIRAAALLRLGRNLRKAGRHGEALSVYGRLAGLGAVIVEGLPAELAAEEARCAVWEELGKTAELRRGAGQVGEGLLSGRWRLGSAAWESQREQASKWLGGLEVDEERRALAEAAGRLWGERGRGRSIWNLGRPVLAVWTDRGGVVASAAVLDGALEEARPFVAVLADFAEPRVGLRVERSPASTKLPWTLAVYGDEDVGELAGRARLLGAGFVLLVLLLLAGSYVVARAVAREMAVVRLQADFVAAVSHEFRSPLSSISQMGELLAEDRWPTPEHRRRGVEVLNRESARLRRLVEGLLDFARMEAGNGAYRLEPVDLGEVAREVAAEFRTVTVTGETGLVPADGEAMRRALWNLVENAVKYSAEGTPVQVAVGREGGRVRIRVRDGGMGIPGEELGRVFVKFYRGREARERRVKGTGIGLAMVKHIVEGHGGEIRVESEAGRGSTFTIVLPEGRDA
jgi:signal transduction histidine kinase